MNSTTLNINTNINTGSNINNNNNNNNQFDVSNNTNSFTETGQPIDFCKESMTYQENDSYRCSSFSYQNKPLFLGQQNCYDLNDNSYNINCGDICDKAIDISYPLNLVSKTTTNVYCDVKKINTFDQTGSTVKETTNSTYNNVVNKDNNNDTDKKTGVNNNYDVNKISENDNLCMSSNSKYLDFEKIQCYKHNNIMLFGVTLIQGLIAPDTMLNEIITTLEVLVEEGLIDWNQDSLHISIFDGRVYALHDDAHFRCQVYQTNDENECLLEVHRMAGDGFIFNYFRRKFLRRLCRKRCIVNDEFYVINGDTNDKKNNTSFVASFDNDFFLSSPFLNNNDNDDESSDSYPSQQSFTNELESEGTEIECTIFSTDNHDHNNNCDDSNNCNNTTNTTVMKIVEAESLISNATNRKSYCETLRDDVSILRRAVNNPNDSFIIAQIDNVFEDLLKPITSEDPLLDTWIIKNLLEIITKLIPFSKCECPIPIEVIVSIWKKWCNNVEHPLGITTFIRSQQICRVCQSCLQILKPKESKIINII